MKLIGAEEKADILLDETLRVVSRRGMISQKRLKEARNLDSALPYGHSDNDGSFTSGYAIGEILKYATFKREKGADHPDTLKAKLNSTPGIKSKFLNLYGLFLII